MERGKRPSAGIEDYLLIGDLHTAALVSNRGSVDWMCLPHFDSPAVFAAILDPDNGGAFRIETDGYDAQAAYVADTAIVETRFSSGEHRFTVHDYMVPYETEERVPHFLVRTFRGEEGENTVTVTFDPRPDYARSSASLRQEEGRLSMRAEGHTLWLHLPDGAAVRDLPSGGAEISFSLSEGQTVKLVMEFSLNGKPLLHTLDTEKAVRDFWREWVGKGRYLDFSRDALVRSAITLKLMQFYPTGAIIASPTASLPEEIGGERNWDYRYTWVRDATFALYALSILGYRDEAMRFFRFIEDVVETSRKNNPDGLGDLHLLYTIHGGLPRMEEHLDHLSGHRDSRPVRIGNDAVAQFQLDVYGTLIDAYYFMFRHGLELSSGGKQVIRELVGHIRARWMEKDHGIWEIRRDTQHYTYGKVMCWVGVDRALRLADELGVGDAEKAEWQTLSYQIRDWIWQHCYDEGRGTFTQHPNTQAQDASNFLFIPLQFLDRHEESSKKVLEETRKELCPDDLRVYRYRNPDGLAGDEGSFILCTQWMIASLAATGGNAEAESMFRRLEKGLDRHGLFPEEMEGEDCVFLGNFPLAFSHMGHIFSAYYLERYGND